jgi:hypothetical protein
MVSTNKLQEVIVQQGKNVLVSMKNLEHSAKKKSKERSDLFEKFCANKHSFDVYTYIDSDLEQLAEVQAFLQKLELFSDDFECVRRNFDADVDVKQAETMYEEVLTAYNAMVKVLGFADDAVNAKRF